jgi:hypothetical protein
VYHEEGYGTKESGLPDQKILETTKIAMRGLTHRVYLCRIAGYNIGGYEEFYILGYNAVYSDKD